MFVFLGVDSKSILFQQPAVFPGILERMELEGTLEFWA